jgi:hypothetical protein
MKEFRRGVLLGAVALAAVFAFGATTANAVPNKCLAGKVECVSKKDACILGVNGKALKGGRASRPPEAAEMLRQV